MGSSLKDDGIFSKLPVRLYERMIKDIPAANWLHILDLNPIVKKKVLEGFSPRPEEFSKMFYQPPIMNCLSRELQTNKIFFEKILAEWKEEQSSAVSCLAMFDSGFMSRNVWKLRDLFGPARFCIGLYSLGLLDRPWAADAIMNESFWSRTPDASLFDLLVPTLSVWGEFIEKYPGLSGEFLESNAGSGFLFDVEADRAEQGGGQQSREPFKKVEKKLKKTQSDLVRAGEQLNSLRGENEEIKKRLHECETEFEKKLSESVNRKRREWFERYQHVDREGAVKETERLESLLQRTRRAFELQKRSDEEYGMIADIRTKLLEIDLSLDHIEGIYAGSLVVHKEVGKVKEALLTEKNRLLKLPGISRIIGPQHAGAGEIVALINLVDPIPANLPKVNKLLKMAGTLSEIGLAGDPGRVEEAVRHKKRQILEQLYSQFEPGRQEQEHETQLRRLEDFIESGRSRGYDLFIDGYNVLLRVHGKDEHFSHADFTKFREQFIEAVTAASRHFAKVWLVFDGIEDSSSVRANTQIIYTDKTKRSADEVIIEKISPRKDKKILLVTGDEGIISSVQDRIFALIDVVDFYMFLFE